jgi:hypothetical protein
MGGNQPSRHKPVGGSVAGDTISSGHNVCRRARGQRGEESYASGHHPIDRTRDNEVLRLVDLGARPVDIGQGDKPWVVMADPEGNEFCVMPHFGNPYSAPQPPV